MKCDNHHPYACSCPEPTDMEGVKLEVGQRVAAPYKSGHSALIEITRVTRIDGDNVYLGDSKQPRWYPQRLLVIP